MFAPLLLLLQAAAPAAGGERFSILADPCASAQDPKGNDVVVCGRRDAISPRIPLRDFRGVPDHPVPSNPDMTGIGALRGPGIGNECGAYGEDCPVGLGGAALPKVLDAAAGLTHGLFARRHDRTGRVAIDLTPAPIPPNAIRP